MPATRSAQNWNQARTVSSSTSGSSCSEASQASVVSDTYEKSKSVLLAKKLMLADGLAPADVATSTIQQCYDRIEGHGVRNIVDNPQKAIKLFDAAFALNTSSMPVYWRAEAEAEMGDYREAIADLDAFLLDKPGFAMGHALRGNMFAKIGNHKAALRNFDTSLRLDRHCDEVRKARGMSHYASENFEQAVADLEASQRYAEVDEEFFKTLANCYAMLGDKAKAKKNSAYAEIYKEP